MQDRAPVRRCDIKGRTRRQGRKRRSVDENRDKGGDGNGHEERDGNGNATEKRMEGRGSLGIYEVVEEAGRTTR